MLWHYIKLSFRELLKDKLNSLINIVGLAIGMAAVILISIYVQHELSYDKFNEKHNRIFRMLTKVEQQDKEEITQIRHSGYSNIKLKNKRFNEIKSLFVDTNFHKVFTLRRIQSANPSQLFNNPNSVVINKRTALKLFNTTNAVGKEFETMGYHHTVSTVVENLPTTSHYDFDILFPLTISASVNNMKSIEYMSYALLKPGVDIEKTRLKINKLYNKKLIERFGKYNLNVQSLTQKLSDIHLKSNYRTYLKPQGKINSIYIQIFLAFLILIIAIINFTNIIIVQYDSKLCEIGIQKAIGATRLGIMKKIFAFTVSLVFFAVLLGIILSEILLPYFSNLMSRNLQIDHFENPILFIGIPSLIILVSLLSGLYPSFMISRYSPAAIIKGNTKTSNKTNRLSQALVIFQFAISMILIASVIIVQMQIKFMKESNLGFEPNKVIAIENLSSKQAKSYQGIREELLKNPNIEQVSASIHTPGEGASGQGIRLANTGIDQTKLINEYRISPGYFKLLGIQFVDGKGFEEFNQADEKNIIINEKALKLLNIEDAVGREVYLNDTKQTIKGVVKNFHYDSMTEEIKPLLFTKTESVNTILIKTKYNNYNLLMEDIRKVFSRIDNERTISYKLIDDICRNRYQKEEREKSLAVSSSVLSILLALLGLYALTLFIIQKRTKEIGVRKIAGASFLQIIQLLFSTYANWLLIAFIISIPFVWFIMNQWLEGFAYRIEIGVLPFLISGIITIFFALLTVLVQTWKAANQNPIESLRYE